MFFSAHYQNENRSFSIDLLRGLSIFFVIFMHFTFGALPSHDITVSWFPLSWDCFITIARNGYYGVSVFFVISGFLITTKILERSNGKLKNINIRQFYFFRFSRIIPGLILLSILNLFFYQLYFHDFYFPPESGIDIKEALIYLFTFRFNYFYVYHSGNNMATWAILWSIAIEEAFYLIYPLICSFLRFYYLILLALIAFVIFGPYYRMEATLDSSYLYFGCFDQLALGCLTALFVNSKLFKKTSSIVRYTTLVLGIILMVFTYIIADVSVNYVWGPTFVALGASMYLLGQDRKQQTTLLATQWTTIRNIGIKLFFPLCILGVLSYEVYLFHMIFFVFLHFFSDYYLTSGTLIYFFPYFLITCVLLATIAGLLYFYLLEPIRKWLRKLTTPLFFFFSIRRTKESNEV